TTHCRITLLDYYVNRAATTETYTLSLHDALPISAGPLTGVCPDPLVIQADWFPLVEQGPLYALLDRDHQVVTAEDGIVQARLEFDGVDQGIVLEIRSGGAAIAHTDVPRLLHEEPELFGGLD